LANLRGSGDPAMLTDAPNCRKKNPPTCYKDRK
jgi:hypothetical protein